MKDILLRKKQRSKNKIAMLIPILILFAVVYAYPFGRTFFLSFFKISFGESQAVYIGLDHFINQFKDPVFWDALWKSLYWTFGNLFIQLTVPIGIALLLNVKIQGINLARSFIMFPWVVPTVAIAVCMRLMLLPKIGIISEILSGIGIIDKNLHLLGNTTTAMPTLILLNSWKFLPFGTLMILASLQTIPTDVYDAAKVDGTTYFQRFAYITFPYIGSMIWFVGFLAFSWNFNTFDLIWLTTQGGPGSASQTLPVLIYRRAFKTFRLGEASALSVIIAVILAVMGILYFKYFSPKEKSS